VLTCTGRQRHNEAGVAVAPQAVLQQVRQAARPAAHNMRTYVTCGEAQNARQLSSTTNEALSMRNESNEALSMDTMSTRHGKVCFIQVELVGPAHAVTACRSVTLGSSPHLYGTCFAVLSVNAATTCASADSELLIDVSSLTLHSEWSWIKGTPTELQ
jgi:hypothetical protein